VHHLIDTRRAACLLIPTYGFSPVHVQNARDIRIDSAAARIGTHRRHRSSGCNGFVSGSQSVHQDAVPGPIIVDDPDVSG
jgi:hypothetical protein